MITVKWLHVSLFLLVLTTSFVQCFSFYFLYFGLINISPILYIQKVFITKDQHHPKKNILSSSTLQTSSHIKIIMFASKLYLFFLDFGLRISCFTLPNVKEKTFRLEVLFCVKYIYRFISLINNLVTFHIFFKKGIYLFVRSTFEFKFIQFSLLVIQFFLAIWGFLQFSGLVAR